MNTKTRAGVGLILALLLASGAYASGSLGAYLRLADIDHYPEATIDEFGYRDAHYLGMAGDWHLFMRMVTSVANGMPWSDGQIIKIRAADVAIQNAWIIEKDERFIQASACPLLEFRDGKWAVSGDGQRGVICGTQ